MIHFIKGNVALKLDGAIVLENGGIGYKVFVPSTSEAYLADTNDRITLYTVMIVREDDLSLFGFTDHESLELFNKLITVSGVGAKAAMAILSVLTVNEIKKAVVFNDPDQLARAQGVGKKTAQRIVLELQDKLDGIGGFAENQGMPALSNKGKNEMNAISEAIDALVSLGYSKSEASEALARLNLEEATAEEYIKQALRALSVF